MQNHDAESLIMKMGQDARAAAAQLTFAPSECKSRALMAAAQDLLENQETNCKVTH